MKLSKSYGQYRVTIPRELISEVGFDNALFVRLESGLGGLITIREYHGKGKEKRDVPENQA